MTVLKAILAFIGQWLFNMFWATDAYISTILGGEPDDTISERVGRAYDARASFPWWHWLIATWANNFVNFVMFCVTLGRQHNHCANSLIGKTACKELWNWGGVRKEKVM
jgi:hypothetical protein